MGGSVSCSSTGAGGGAEPPYPVSFGGNWTWPSTSRFLTRCPMAGCSSSPRRRRGRSGKTPSSPPEGPIQISINSVNLNATEFGDNFGLFCATYPNDSEPTGLATNPPEMAPVEPEIAVGSATIPPPTEGGEGPYELVLPRDAGRCHRHQRRDHDGLVVTRQPGQGSQFDVTGYQATLELPSSIVSAAAALGGDEISGTATDSIDASNATPATISTGPLSFDLVSSSSGAPQRRCRWSFLVAGDDVGPFTASGGGIVVSQEAAVQLSIEISGPGRRRQRGLRPQLHDLCRQHVADRYHRRGDPGRFGDGSRHRARGRSDAATPPPAAPDRTSFSARGLRWVTSSSTT